MDDKKNALAELAEEMQGIVTSIYYGSGNCGVAEARKICKALRIIAELAKVSFFQTKNGTKYVRLAESAVALEKCRAIAEEGADNGK